MPSTTTTHSTLTLRRESQIDISVTSDVDTLLGYIESQIGAIYLNQEHGDEYTESTLLLSEDDISKLPSHRDLKRATRQINQMPECGFGLWYYWIDEDAYLYLYW